MNLKVTHTTRCCMVLEQLCEYLKNAFKSHWCPSDSQSMPSVFVGRLYFRACWTIIACACEQFPGARNRAEQVEPWTLMKSFIMTSLSRALQLSQAEQRSGQGRGLLALGISIAQLSKALPACLRACPNQIRWSRRVKLAKHFCPAGCNGQRGLPRTAAETGEHDIVAKVHGLSLHH